MCLNHVRVQYVYCIYDSPLRQNHLAFLLVFGLFTWGKMFATLVGRGELVCLWLESQEMMQVLREVMVS
ncbi:uncharacterized protein YALI1_B30303g [Yarrowia lipolytica]|uniref:Uncharacterized protein n=1 Tax=Yarrowia lipolytica TaxID=4952 RepID=A0A1D8N909_YARLL|nr:hypothetical protein YALI1_B30303g [Yarrowia lipolytica]